MALLVRQHRAAKRRPCAISRGLRGAALGLEIVRRKKHSGFQVSFELLTFGLCRRLRFLKDGILAVGQTY